MITMFSFLDRTNKAFRILSALFISIIFFNGILINASSANPPEISVVKVFAGGNAGSGFVWAGATGKKYIVTSLHTLAGQSSYFYQKSAPGNQLEVFKFDRESDLALLVPKNGTLTLPALELITPKPDQTKSYYIYGFPAGVKQVQGDSLEFSRSKHNVEMKAYLPNKFLGPLTENGFPLDTLTVLRVSSGITPGHSGAPIVEAGSNAVIGIGAGGLSHVGFQRVNWAVPALSYLPNIEKNGEAGSVTNLTAESVDGKRTRFSVYNGDDAAVIAGNHKYYKIYEVPLGELMRSFSESPYEDSAPILNQSDWMEATEIGYSPENVLVDVYQNIETGAMIFVPSGTSLTMQHEIMHAINGSGKIKMFFKLAQTASYTGAISVKDQFKHYLYTQYGEDWEIADNETDEPIHDPLSGFWNANFALERFAHEEDDRPQSEALVNMMIVYNENEGYGDFLGTSVVGLNIDNFNNNERAIMHQMHLCALISGFAP